MSQNIIRKYLKKISGMGMSLWQGSTHPSLRTRFQKRSRRTVSFLRAGHCHVKSHKSHNNYHERQHNHQVMKVITIIKWSKSSWSESGLNLVIWPRLWGSQTPTMSCTSGNFHHYLCHHCHHVMCDCPHLPLNHWSPSFHDQLWPPIMITRPDLYTERHCQWFYFRLQRMRPNTE